MRRGLGIHNRRSPGVFNPLSLFQGGIVQGAWYDPSDLTTLFQDSAGTTPVTAVEQPVGLMLDKSKGLVLGSEVVASPLAGTLGASYTIVGDTVVRNGSTGTAVLNTVGGNPVVQDRTYLVQFTASNVTGDSVAIRVGNGTAYGPFAGNGTFTVRAVSGGTTAAALTFLPWGGGAGTATYSNISVKALPGNHAYQTTSASRPTLRARYNLLTFSEEFENAAWVKLNATVSANAGVAPDGTTTADLVYPSFSGSYHGSVYQTGRTGNRLSVCAKAAGFQWLYFVNTGGSAAVVWFDVLNGITGTVGAGYTATITSLGNGWYRCTAEAASGNFASPQFGPSNTDNGVLATASGTNGLLFWGAQLTQPAVFPSNTYQRVGAATDYATGAAFPPYLFFDGTDDSMTFNNAIIGNSAFTGFVGAIQQGSLSGRRAFVSIGSGTVRDGLDFGYGASAGRYNFTEAGVADFLGNPANYPNNVVQTATYENSGRVYVYRENGVQQATATDSSNLVLTTPGSLGTRYGSITQGNIYSVILVGQLCTSGQISSTESWVAAKTPLGAI